MHEFHKVLPSAFKQLLRNSDEKMKKAVTRLVDIWEERKVAQPEAWLGLFASRDVSHCTCHHLSALCLKYLCCPAKHLVCAVCPCHCSSCMQQAVCYSPGRPETVR